MGDAPWQIHAGVHFIVPPDGGTLAVCFANGETERKRRICLAVFVFRYLQNRALAPQPPGAGVWPTPPTGRCLEGRQIETRPSKELPGKRQTLTLFLRDAGNSLKPCLNMIHDDSLHSKT
jgi:hypothetical protein